MPVLPFPSGPWHTAHLLLKVSAPSSAIYQVEKIIANANTHETTFITFFIALLLLRSGEASAFSS
jgi:hypothetical protein